ncbi:MAG TPA: hypothetical protein PKE27_18765 [Povalibacter sp.]|uniref:hypothetical protein n=1 Tax=Povalibacter sp. TaxID=1962978 RepID=UPI002C3C55D9|nr:hypothetical protein [Povalibacter sp.]HMN46626.1 hypothetical protein [Povalibacter sp.]
MHRVHRRWLWLILIAFVATRLADVHLHLCLDGEEPASAVHLGDGSVHNDEHHTGTGHADRDVNVFDVVLLKKQADPSDVLMPVLLLAMLLLLLPPRSSDLPRLATAFVPLRSLFLLKPPLRGPPL